MRIMILIAMTLTSVLGAAACLAPNAPGSARYVWVEPSVSISGDTVVNQEIQVTGKATALEEDLEDAELWLVVTGAVALSGEDRWHGPLKLGQTKEISATYRWVTPGKQAVSANVLAGIERGQPGMRSPQLLVDVKAPQGDALAATSIGQRWEDSKPRGGSLLFRDTSLYLNRTNGPLVKVIDSEADLRRLQQEGLVPQELRYEWFYIDPEHGTDFSKRFVMLFYDSPVILDEDRGLVSPVSVYNFGRAMAPGGTTTFDSVREAPSPKATP